MTSKAQARRNRRKWKAQQLPELAPIERNEQPRHKGRFIRSEEDPQKTARTARLRQLPGGDTGKHKDDALAPLLGCPMGFVILTERRRDVASALWDVWQAYCAAERTYRLRILGLSGEPKGASLEMTPETISTNPDEKPDLRSEDEKDRDASNNWMRWQGYLGCIPKEQASLLRRAEKGTCRPLWQDCAPTQTGMAALAALEALAEV